ncbi:MAG TPA: erythromycin esterase family protein, partial [Thermoanaerobaculia bacterium]
MRFLFICLLLAAVAADAAPRRRLVVRAGSAEAQWVRARAIAVESTDPDVPPADLAPLAAIIGADTVVTLGEGTHFTSEFQTMHHRVIRFLAESLGYRTFAFEASWPDFRAIDDYLRTGEGDPVALVEDASWRFWDTREMADLIAWARSWNAARPESDWISFAGVDPSVPERLVAHLVEYLKRVDPAAVTSASTSLGCLKGLGAYHLESDAYRAACRASLESVGSVLAANRAAYEATAGARSFAGAARSASMILQAERIASGSVDWAEARDEAMADNVRALAETSPGGKIAYRAHNGHASANGYIDAGRRRASAGYFLRRTFGDRMFAIGSTGSHGTYHAQGPPARNQPPSFGVFPFPTPLAGSWEEIFEQ